MDDDEYRRAVDAHWDAVHRAHQAWDQTHRGEPWPACSTCHPRYGPNSASPNCRSPRTVSRCHRTWTSPARTSSHHGACTPMLSEQARARVQAHKAAIAEATVTAALDADFAAWEPEAEP